MKNAYAGAAGMHNHYRENESFWKWIIFVLIQDVTLAIMSANISLSYVVGSFLQLICFAHQVTLSAGNQTTTFVTEQ